jgi:Tfp pilus assembly protein FimT
MPIRQAKYKLLAVGAVGLEGRCILRSQVRIGLTLIEMVLVTILLAMISTAIVVGFRGPFERARFESFCDKLAGLDDRARQAAVAVRYPGSIRFDLPEQQLELSRWHGGLLYWQKYPVPKRIRIASITLVDGRHVDESVLIPIGVTGGTPSYAIEVVQGDRRRWVVFIGGSGQSYETESQTEFDATFTFFRQSGIDPR